MRSLRPLVCDWPCQSCLLQVARSWPCISFDKASNNTCNCFSSADSDHGSQEAHWQTPTLALKIACLCNLTNAGTSAATSCIKNFPQLRLTVSSSYRPYASAKRIDSYQDKVKECQNIEDQALMYISSNNNACCYSKRALHHTASSPWLLNAASQ